MLQPCEDLPWLLDKYRRDVCSITGVPFEMIAGRDGGGHETVRKTIASGRLFSTNMHEICRHLQNLLTQACAPDLHAIKRASNAGAPQVYRHIYGRSGDADFLLVPMPRLEVETIQDFKILYEIGALTPDMSIKISRVLLGEEPGDRRKRQRADQSESARANKAQTDKGVKPANQDSSI